MKAPEGGGEVIYAHKCGCQCTNFHKTLNYSVTIWKSSVPNFTQLS